MFQESLVESTSLLRGRSRWPAVISFALQATIATTLIVLPLLHPEILPLRAPRISLTAPTLKPPVVVEQRVRMETSSAASSPVTRLRTGGEELDPLTDSRTRGATVDQPTLAVGESTWRGRAEVRYLCWDRVGLRDRIWWWGRARVRCMFLLA